MDTHAWIAVTVVLLTLCGLVFSRLATDVVMLAALSALMLSGVLDAGQALQGFGNPGLATVAVLYVVVAGLSDSGAVAALGTRLLGRPSTVAGAQLRLMLPVAGMSAFLNNTPLVAMFAPVVADWSRRCRIPTSKLMIPLSYAATFGGSCTIIGTSTNLVVLGMLRSRGVEDSMGFFDLGAVGVPAALLGIGVVVLTSRWLLPDRTPPLREAEGAREYAIEMLVETSSPLIGKSLEAAGLRRLPGAFLAEIVRADTALKAVAPTERLQARDRLLFVGVVDSMVELVRQRGLVPAPDQLFKLDAPRAERRLIEAVVSASSPIAGRSIRKGNFRTRYDAVVIAVARNGERLRGKVGDVVLRPGDTLLIEARPSFLSQHGDSPDFLLVSEVRGATLPRHDRAWIAGTVLAAMVAAATLGLLSMLEAGCVAAGLMLATRCTTPASARRSVDWSVLTVIGASLGLGTALHDTGAAEAMARAWIGLAGADPWVALVAIYLLTNVFTEVITNIAAAVLVLPIALSTAAGLGVSPWPFAVAVMMAASASFSTPIGYQTNLMVQGVGGYRFSDYLRMGPLVNLTVCAVTVAVAPMVWPFHPAG